MAKEVDKYLTSALHASKHQDSALRDLLHNDFALPNNKIQLFTLLKNFKKKGIIKLGKAYWDILCPANGETDIESLDITSLAIIFRNIEHIVLNFDDQMRKLKQKYEQIVAQACKDRNKLSHTPKDPMIEKDFIKIMKSMTKTLIGMNYSQMKIFDYWKTCPISDNNKVKQELHTLIDNYFTANNFSWQSTQLMSQQNPTTPTSTLTPTPAPMKISPKLQQKLKSSQKKLDEQQEKYKLSVAIDFGTSNCAVAYSYAWDKERVFVLKDWKDGVDTDGKVPTAILFENVSGKTSIEFGNRAVWRYRQSIIKNEHHQNYFFKDFKMKLYKQKTPFKKSLCDTYNRDDRDKNQIEVFVQSIRYLKIFLMKQLERGGDYQNFNEEEIVWVITVPAIWDDNVKEFMQEAAKNAGCLNVVIALEPEAASIYCQSKPSSVNILFQQILQYRPNPKYLVVDIGGGTLDITAHELLDGNHIKEIHRSSGNDLGGLKVNMLFQDSLKELFADNAITHIQDKHPRDWNEIMDQFEIAKKKFKHGSNDGDMDEMIDLSRSCKKYLKKRFCKDSNPAKKGVKIQNKCLIVPKAFIRSLLDSITQNIVDYVKDLLSQPSFSDIHLDAIVLVGGFAKSLLVQEAIQQCVGKTTKVFVPMLSPELCVVKGAVLFGWKREVIRSRISRYTFGFRAIRKGENDKDEDGSERLESEGEFVKLVSINQEIPIGQLISSEQHFDFRNEELVRVEFYRTEIPDPKNINDSSMEKVGSIDIQKHRQINCLQMCFGETDINVLYGPVNGETYIVKLQSEGRSTTDYVKLVG